MTEKISLAIVDDHKLIRQMWEKIFSDVKEIEVIGGAGTFDEAIAMVKDKRPDVLLLDINLAEQSGIDAVPLIRKISPGTKIIAVSMHSQVAYAKKMLALGAKAYVTKNSPTAEIFEALEVVMKGGIYLCEEIMDKFSAVPEKREKTKEGNQNLSLREIEIIKKIKEGLSSKEIAALLFIGVRTVEVHRRNILQKLQLKNTAALINFINHTDLDFS